jgi:hypothetical protein
MIQYVEDKETKSQILSHDVGELMYVECVMGGSTTECTMKKNGS